jgi:hypothetical protein
MRRRVVPLRWWLSITLLTGGLWVGVASGVALADCGGRSVSVTPSAAPPTSTVTVYGDGWFGRCVDSGGACARTGVFDPIQDIELRIVLRDSGGLGNVLATVDANEDFAFRVRVPLPRELLEGGYILRASPADGTLGARTEFRVTSG